jgi:hypothetical protein
MAVGEVHPDDGPYAGVGEGLVDVLGRGGPSVHLADDPPAAVVPGAHGDRRRAVAPGRDPELGLLVQGVDEVTEGPGLLPLEVLCEVGLDHVVGRAVDVHNRDPQELRGVDGLVVVQAEHRAVDLLHPRTNEGLGDVDRDALVVEEVGLQRDHLAEAGARRPQRVVADDSGDRLPLLPQAVRQEDLGRSDVDAPHHADGVDVLVGEVRQPRVRIGVPQALGVVEVLAVLRQGIIGLGRIGQDPVDDVLGADVLRHAGLDGQPVGFLNLHATGMPIARFIFAPDHSRNEMMELMSSFLFLLSVRPSLLFPCWGMRCFGNGISIVWYAAISFVSCAGSHRLQF